MFILKLEASKLDAKLKEMLRRTSDLTPAMQGSLDVVQESVLDEFQGSYYRSPSGAKIPWVKRKREPNPAGKGKILWNRGRLKSAMTGGAGSKTKVSKKSFMYGIDENMGFPGRKSGKSRATFGTIVAAHRGGLGAKPNTSQIAFRNIPARPFAAMSTPLKQDIVSVVRAYVLSLPKRSRRR